MGPFCCGVSKAFFAACSFAVFLRFLLLGHIAPTIGAGLFFFQSLRLDDYN